MELWNGPEVKFNIYGIVVFDLWKGFGIHRKKFRMSPEMFGYENTLFGPKGKAHKVFGKHKRKFCGVQGPDAEAHGVWARHQDCGVWSWSPSGTLAFRAKTDFEEAFAPSLDPRAQHINRGEGLAPKTHQETPSRVPATPSPLVYPPS